MKKRSRQIILTLAGSIIASATAFGGTIAMNPAISSFEYVDLANTTVPTNGQLIADSEAWTIIANVDTAGKPRTFNANSNADGAFVLAANPKNAGDLFRVQSVTIGHSLVDAQEYTFSYDLQRGNISGKPEWVFEVYTADSNLLASVTNGVSVKSTWETFSGSFTVGAADAGKDIFFRVIRDSTIGTMVPKGGMFDNIVLETVSNGARSDSERILAFNADAGKEDFEYVKEGVAVAASVMALDGAASGGSTDGSFGYFVDPVGADASTPAAYPWSMDGANTLVADISITNTSAQDLRLDALNFDVYRTSDLAPRRFELEYIDGDLGPTGSVYGFTIYASTGTNLWKDFSWNFGKKGDNPSTAPVNFNALEDQTLGTNEYATFRLTVKSSTDSATEPDPVLLDNIALTGDFVEEGVIIDWGNPGMFFGDESTLDFRKGTPETTTNGNLIINNYVPALPIVEATMGDGFYQAQNLYAILQTGNDGALSEALGYKYSRIGGATPSTGNIVLNVSSTTNATDVFQSSLLYVKAEDFYNKIATGETITGLAANITELNADSGSARFAVLNDGQWYVSFSKVTASGVLTLGFPTAENAWAAFSPADSASTGMMSADGLAFDTSGSIFTNVQAVGYLLEGKDYVDSNKVAFKVDDFRVEIGAPPGLPDSSVLAFNVDDNAYDFEYVKSGVDVSLNVIMTRGSGTDGSLDGSYGSFYDPTGADTNNSVRPWHGRGDSQHSVEFTVENVLPDSRLDLSGFHFDSVRHNTVALRRYELEYISGDLSGVSSGLVYGVTVATDEFVTYYTTNIVEGVTNTLTTRPWADFDWTFAVEGSTPTAEPVTFNALADTSLAYGQSATFRFNLITSTDAATESGQAWLDNIALLGSQVGVGFGSWINGFGLESGELDADADPDGDGFTNFDEYVRNGNPNNETLNGIGSEVSTSAGVFNFIHPQRADDDSLVYIVELDDNLVVAPGWAAAGYTITGTNVTGGELNFVTNEVVTTEKDEQFVKFTVEQL